MVQRPTSAARLEDESPEATLQIGLLGPLSVVRDGTEVELRGPKRRALLTLLALHQGVPISQETIVEALWPERPTGREESTLQVHISHLRDALEADRAGPPSVVITRESAYMLAGDAAELDIARFDSLAGEARTVLENDPEAALQLLNEALALWRGRPLQDVEYEEFAQGEIRRLEWARTEAVENRAEALVELNRDAAAIEDLEALVRVYPTRERPVSLLMRALYRTGRQAEALRVVRHHARHLAEQGLETSPSLNLLEEQILQHDPSLLPEEMVSPGDIAPGRSVRGYELREEVGSGSIGVVYRAFQAAVGREVAVKIVHSNLAQSPEFVRRFTEEARIVAGLEHPHIVPLHDFWREPAGAFLVMRWMDGGSLEARLGEPWDVDELGRVFDQLADALGYAHSAGIVHRDVRPANVLFDAQGNAYLCDFGLAVAGIETRQGNDNRPTTLEPRYASPEIFRGEGPSVASDVYGLGVLLAEAATGGRFHGVEPPVPENIREVVGVATARNPADRYPDMAAFRAALREAIGPTEIPAPRRVRRNPYKGLEPFDEGDPADFYGRDDVVDTLIDMVGRNGLTAVIGASGSGKSSVVRAGLSPALREGALPGSEEWFIVTMVPGRDPFEEFHLCLREAAVGYPGTTSDEWSRELRDGFDAALDGPNNKALLVIDQFEEVFSSEVDDETRQRFLDNLVELALDPTHRIRILLTLRADFSDRPLAHPRFGELISEASLLLAPMRPDQIEDVIRKPAARVGVQVEPGLTAEIVRDVSSATSYLPHLQYILSELFDRRIEDRLTVQAYRSLGGVHGVLERRAEATYSSLSRGAQQASRQLFLRMVHLGEHGEETRRRLPLTDLRGLGDPAEVDEALEGFAAARILIYDRDPVTRIPTVEVAHETVISQWTRFRIWIDEARADLLAHRRISAATVAWAESGEDPAYLLTGGPLASALDIAQGDRVSLNELEARFISESREAEEEAKRREEERQRERAALQHRAKRRLTIGIGTAVVAAVIAVLAAIAWNQGQQADRLRAAQERQNIARQLAAASVGNLSSDPQLSLLLAIEAAEQTLEDDGGMLDEVVDALHRAVINPKPEWAIDGAAAHSNGQALDFSPDGAALAVVADDGGAMVLDPNDEGTVLRRLGPAETPAFGLEFHPNGESVLTLHPDAVRQWHHGSGDLQFEISAADVGIGDGVEINTGDYSRDGSMIAIGDTVGTVRIVRQPTATSSGEIIELADGHTDAVTSVDFDPSGTRLVSGSRDNTVLVWDIESGTSTPANTTGIGLPIYEVEWHPTADIGAVTTAQGEIFVFNTQSGERINSFGTAQVHSREIAFNPSGSFLVAAGLQGSARVFGTFIGGAAVTELPNSGVPLEDAEFSPSEFVGLTIATVDVEGRVRFWGDNYRSELAAKVYPYLYPDLAATPDGSRYTFAAYWLYTGFPRERPTVEVIDAATGRSLFSRPTDLSGDVGRGSAITDDGSTVAYAGPDGQVTVADVSSGERRSIPESTCWTSSFDFNSDGSLLATGGYDGSVSIWDVKTAELNRSLRDEAATPPSMGCTGPSVRDVEFEPGGDELVSARTDGTVTRWNAETGRHQVLHEFGFEARSATYSPDGSRIAASDRTGNIQILDSDSGEIVLSPEPVSGPVNVTFSPDGRFLAGAGPHHLAYLWDQEAEGRIVRQFHGATLGPSAVAFVNDGSELRAMGGDGVVRGYTLVDEKLLEIARSQVDRDLTEEECRRYLQRACD